MRVKQSLNHQKQILLFAVLSSFIGEQSEPAISRPRGIWGGGGGVAKEAKTREI